MVQYNTIQHNTRQFAGTPQQLKPITVGPSNVYAHTITYRYQECLETWMLRMFRFDWLKTGTHFFHRMTSLFKLWKQLKHPVACWFASFAIPLAGLPMLPRAHFEIADAHISVRKNIFHVQIAKLAVWHLEPKVIVTYSCGNPALVGTLNKNLKKLQSNCV